MTFSHLLMVRHQAGDETDLFSLELLQSLQNLPLVSFLSGHSLQVHLPEAAWDHCVQHAPGQPGVCGLDWQTAKLKGETVLAEGSR